MIKNVLLIDDLRWPRYIRNPDDTEHYRNYRDDEVTIARTAEEGIDLLHARTTWDVLLLDHDLGPGKDGMDVIKYLEENQRLLPSRVYLVTANSVKGPLMYEYLVRWKEAGLIQEIYWIR